jgi:hypothetical protein
MVVAPNVDMSGEQEAAGLQRVRSMEGLAAFTASNIFADVEMVQDTMDYGCEYERSADDKDQAGVQREKPGEEFAAETCGRVDWAHTAEKHGRIQKGVDPRHTLR